MSSASELREELMSNMNFFLSPDHHKEIKLGDVSWENIDSIRIDARLHGDLVKIIGSLSHSQIRDVLFGMIVTGPHINKCIGLKNIPPDPVVIREDDYLPCEQCSRAKCKRSYRCNSCGKEICRICKSFSRCCEKYTEI